MKTSKTSLVSFCSKLICASFIVIAISCAPKKSNTIDQSPGQVADKEVHPILDEPEEMFSIQQTSDETSSDRKDLRVVLAVDSIMYLGQSGMMQVWIGDEDVDVAISNGMTKDEKIISSSIARFAKITPYAPDFEIKALSATICYKIDPSGSEVTYSLIPKDEGEYNVSAAVELYETEDCTGISIPKMANRLSVSVGVDMNKAISKKVHKLEEVVWDKFLIFWAALITLLFGSAIYLVRRYIKNKTGYDEGLNNK